MTCVLQPDACGEAFASALETCIRDTADAVARTDWHSECEAPVGRTSYQATQFEATLAPLRVRYGHVASLWCAFYVAPMALWPHDARLFGYDALLCPKDRSCSGQEQLSGREERGVPYSGTQAASYRIEMFSMSCALCNRLRARFGAPPYSPHAWQGMWDLHAYGEWYSSSVWPQQRDEPAPFMEAFAAHRITDGQELRGFVAGSLVRLAHEALLADPAEWVAKACARSFTLDAMGVSGQSNWDCAHAAGYGFMSFYQSTDVSVETCQSPALELPFRRAAKEGGRYVRSEDIDSWRAKCVEGVLNGALDALDVRSLRLLDERGVLAKEMEVAKRVCPACVPEDMSPETLVAGKGNVGKTIVGRLSGAAEAVARLQLVQSGACDAFGMPPPSPPTPLPLSPRWPPSPPALPAPPAPPQSGLQQLVVQMVHEARVAVVAAQPMQHASGQQRPAGTARDVGLLAAMLVICGLLGLACARASARCRGLEDDDDEGAALPRRRRDKSRRRLPSRSGYASLPRADEEPSRGAPASESFSVDLERRAHAGKLLSSSHQGIVYKTVAVPDSRRGAVYQTVAIV